MITDDELRSIVDGLPIPVLALDRNLHVAYANVAARRLYHPGRLRDGQPPPPPPPPGRGFYADLAAVGKEIFQRNTGALPRTFSVAGADVTAFPSHDGGLLTFCISPASTAERARTDLVANAAHELLTPLTGIASAAHVLDAGAKEVPELRDRFLGHIARECNRLTRLARGLLVLARAQSGQEPPRPEAVGLRALLDDVTDATPGAELAISCTDELRVFVDRDLVETALSNLVANAVRHSTDGAVAIECSPIDGRVSISITHAGHEATEDEIARFTERFASGGGRDGGGFGLGVSIASDALHTVGGTLVFEHAGGETRTLVALPGIPNA